MAELVEKIKNELIQAQKAGDKEKIDTLRLINAEIKNKQIEAKKELNDKAIVELLRKEVKKRKDSIKAYANAGRDDLKEKEEKELALIEGYLPAQMGEDDVKQAVSKIISNNPDIEFGPLMGMAMKELKEKADGQMVKAVVEEELNKTK